ncbi:MAG: tetratricopeptide repeat protein [Vicinamibacteria bacterium]
MEDLRYHFQQTPSLANRVALAQGLYHQGNYDAAGEHFTEALRQEPQDLEALYGSGLTSIARKEYSQAAERLKTLLEIDKTYRQYAAWPALAHALFEDGRREECLGALKRLVEANPRMQHKVLLAQYLEKAGKPDEAHDVLNDALSEHERSPRFLKRRNYGHSSSSAADAA